jgi:hypothetical protein
LVAAERSEAAPSPFGFYVAEGSCGEVRAQLAIASDQGHLNASDYDRLHDLARRVSGMLSNFIAHLQSSDYQGEKFSRPKRLATTDTRIDRLLATHGVKLPNYDGEPNDSKQ